MAEAATGRFRTAVEAVAWIKEAFGAAYAVSGMHRLRRRPRCRPKVPRPLAEKASPEAQEAWTGGLRRRPSGGGRDGRLPARLRRRAAPGAARGVKVRQRVRPRYEWRYLALAVAGVAGRLWWRWLPNMRREAMAPAVPAWRDEGIAALVWDGAPAHRARLVRDVGVALVTQPPAAPELNPAERVFEELRRAVAGLVDATLAEKVAAVERELAALVADPARLRRLTGWSWIAANLAQLPAPNLAPS